MAETGVHRVRVCLTQDETRHNDVINALCRGSDLRTTSITRSELRVSITMVDTRLRTSDRQAATIRPKVRSSAVCWPR